MEKDNTFSPLDNSEPSILSNSNEAHKLISAGMETEAKNKFPLEFFLLKKYMDRSLDDFNNQIKNRIRLDAGNHF